MILLGDVPQNSGNFLQITMILGRYCGPSGDVGPVMSAKLLKSNGKIVVQYMFISLIKTETKIPEVNTERAIFDASIKDKPGNEANYEDYTDDPDYDTPFFKMYEDDLSGEAKRIPEYDEADVDQYDKYVNAKVLLDHNNTQLCGIVKGRKREQD